MNTMDVQTLVSTLQQAIKNRNLPFSVSLFESEDIEALLKIYFADGTVVVQDAAVKLSDDEKSAVVEGTVTYGQHRDPNAPRLECIASLVLTPSSNNIALMLTLTPPPDWKLTDAFDVAWDPALSGLTFASGGLVICSASCTEPTQKLDLKRGMTLVAELDIKKSCPALVLLVSDSPIPVHGVVTDPNLPLMELETAPCSLSSPQFVEKTKLEGLSICYMIANIAAAKEMPITMASVLLKAKLLLGKDNHGNDISGSVTAGLPIGSSLLTIDTAFTNVNLGDFKLLEPYLGKLDPLASLPKDIRTAITTVGKSFHLSALSFSFDMAELNFPMVSVVFKVDLRDKEQKGFQPFPVLPLSIDDLIITLTQNRFGTQTLTSFSAIADIEVETCPFFLGIQTQSGAGYQIFVREGENAKLKVSDIVKAFLPKLELPELVPDLGVEGFSMTLSPRDNLYQLSAIIEGSWSVLEKIGIELATLTVNGQYANGDVSGIITGTLSLDVPPLQQHRDSAFDITVPVLFDDFDEDEPSASSVIDLQVTALKKPDGGGWVLSGQTGPDQEVPISDLIAALEKNLNISGVVVPSVLDSLTIENLGMRLETSTEKFHFCCQINIEIEDKPIEILVEVSVKKGTNSCDIDFGGTILVGHLEFDIRFAKKSQSNVLFAEYHAKEGVGMVNVKTLVNSILPDLAKELPNDLEIELKDAVLAIVIDKTTKFFFAMDIAVEFPLSELPLVGKLLSSGDKAGIKNLKLVVTSAALSADEVKLINGMAPKPVLPVPADKLTGDAIPKGVSMVAELELGSFTMLLTSPPASQPKPQSDLCCLGADELPKSDPVMWINVQKRFGPVSIQKVGFSYRNGDLLVLSNLALSVGGLEIDLISIGIGSPISHPSIHFTIEGLAVSYVQGPVSVMGGMIGTIDPLDFTGALSVRVPGFMLAVLAGYKLYESHPSFFLYGVLNAPLGGPPAFFVTGVAAGMGFNRKLLLPDVTGVATFPLVEWAQGKKAPSMDPAKPAGLQVTEALKKLANSGVMLPSVGDYWFAVGIQFTSFELVNSFALLTVSAGTDVEIALLGLSTVTVPPAPSVPVAVVQLAFEVSFSYNKGLIAVAGQLTNNSYVLSPDCHLTGGFAFYLWFKGDHTGETVLSLGGFNPNFKVPDYYPIVPRIGISWQVVPELSITGGLYFAVTPNVIMAGGKLNAVWNSGSIQARFTYWADFLMTFKPFHYYIEGGIDLGLSFSVHAWLFSFSVTIHLGVNLALWGPDFAGCATVNLSIISFTIAFGNQKKQTDTAISWKDFIQQLLPKPTSEPRKQNQLVGQKLSALNEADASATPAVVQINVGGGLVRALEPTSEGPCYLINAETFQCVVLTVIPAKSVELTGCGDSVNNLFFAHDSQQPSDVAGNQIPFTSDFGVGPANIKPCDFDSSLKVSMNSPENTSLRAAYRLANVPKGLWECKDFNEHGVPKVDPATALTQASKPNALVGLTLVPMVKPPDCTRPVDLESLLFTYGESQPYAWSPGIPPAGNPFTNETVAGTIEASAVESVRDVLLSALAVQGVTVEKAIDVSSLSKQGNNDLQAAPRLRLLGAQICIV